MLVQQFRAAMAIQRVEAEVDARASCVQKQAHRPWNWIAMDATSRHVIAFSVEDRSLKRAKRVCNEDA
jgi:IS1 family transposase